MQLIKDRMIKAIYKIYKPQNKNGQGFHDATSAGWLLALIMDSPSLPSDSQINKKSTDMVSRDN